MPRSNPGLLQAWQVPYPLCLCYHSSPDSPLVWLVSVLRQFPPPLGDHSSKLEDPMECQRMNLGQPSARQGNSLLHCLLTPPPNIFLWEGQSQRHTFGLRGGVRAVCVGEHNQLSGTAPAPHFESHFFPSLPHPSVFSTPTSRPSGTEDTFQASRVIGF